jgi:hypothetical protein
MHHHDPADMTVEKYLLDELNPEARDQFEEHFFDCLECAADVRAAAGFIAAAKKEFKANPVPKPGARPNGKSLFASFWPSALVLSALAASLLVIAYQNVVVYPRFKAEISELKAPEMLPSVSPAISLVGGNSRDGKVPAFTLEAGHPFLLLLDIPAQDRFSNYTCLLYSPSGSLSWRVNVSGQLAKDTVSIRVPSGDRPSGEYTLTVQGNTDRGETPVELAHYRFALNGH